LPTVWGGISTQGKKFGSCKREAGIARKSEVEKKGALGEVAINQGGISITVGKKRYVEGRRKGICACGRKRGTKGVGWLFKKKPCVEGTEEHKEIRQVPKILRMQGAGKAV